MCTGGGIRFLMQRITRENSVWIYTKLQPPSAFLLKTLFTGAFAEWRKRVLICLKVFADVNNYLRFVSVFIHGGFIISDLVPKGLRPRDDNIDSCL